MRLPEGKQWKVTQNLRFIKCFIVKIKVVFAFSPKKDIYTLYKFTIAYKVFFYKQIYTFVHNHYINTFEITKKKKKNNP